MGFWKGLASVVGGSVLVVGGCTAYVWNKATGDMPDNMTVPEKAGKAIATAAVGAASGATSGITAESVGNVVESATDATIRGTSAAAAGVGRAFKKNFPEATSSVGGLLGGSASQPSSVPFTPPASYPSVGTAGQNGAGSASVPQISPGFDEKAKQEQYKAACAKDKAALKDYPVLTAACEKDGLFPSSQP